MPRGLLLRSAWSKCYGKLYSFVDNAVQAAGPAYTILATVLMSCVIYVFFAVILPSVYGVRSLKGAFHASIALWLVANVFFNYLHCICTDPGSPPSQQPDLRSGLSSRWCKHCQKHKPPFTHHCHICKRCILKMDHHCPWMHNCVGFYNYRFFFVFLLYLSLGCAYATYTSSRLLFAETYDDNDIQILFTFVVSLAMLLALLCLLGWHVFLILTAQTTVDFYINRQRKREARSRGEVWVNEYDLGASRNFRGVFSNGGRLWWLALLVPSRSRPSGDGISFSTRSSKLSRNLLEVV